MSVYQYFGQSVHPCVVFIVNSREDLHRESMLSLIKSYQMWLFIFLIELNQLPIAQARKKFFTFQLICQEGIYLETRCLAFIESLVLKMYILIFSSFISFQSRMRKNSKFVAKQARSHQWLPNSVNNKNCNLYKSCRVMNSLRF